MSRQPAFSLAYRHETALALQMAQAFAAPQDIPACMQAVLNLMDAAQRTERPLTARLDAIRTLTDAEAGRGQAALQAR